MNINDFISSIIQPTASTGMTGTNGMNGTTDTNGNNGNGAMGAGCCCVGTSPTTAFPAETPVGMMYVPFQKWEYVYEPQVALERGTIFEALDKPFIGERTV